LGLVVGQLVTVVKQVIATDPLRARVSELGAELATAYADGKPPVVVGVLHGSMFFMADLIRAMPIAMDIDFLALNRFGEGGRVRIAMDTAINLEGRRVILVEDIVDTGLSLTSVRRLLETRSCESIATVTLFDKVTRRIVDVDVDYRGFEVGDEFLLGYGLDYEGKYRNLDAVWAVMDLGAFTADPSILGRVAFDRAGDSLAT
jgi:hypoxanthine phosphoribosyltransferase